MKQRSAFLILFSLLLSLLSGCDKAMVFDQYQRIENDRWSWEDSIDFLVPIQDTTSAHDILIQLRHTTDYPLSNLYMFVDIKGPSGQTMKDTINFILAENSGKWIGKGVGNLREIAYLYRKNTVFPDTGVYEITIEQAMRLPEVPISEIGVRIELNQP